MGPAIPAVPALARGAVAVIQRAAPAIKETAMKYVRTATNGRVSTDAAVAKFAESGRNALAIVASGATKAGINPDTLFDKAVLDASRDVELQNLVTNLRDDFNRLYRQIDEKSTFLSPMQQQTADDLIARDVIRYVKRAGLGNIAEAHAKLRLFLAMDDALVQRAITLGWDKA